MKNMFAIAAVAVLGFGSAASAATLSIVGGTPGMIPGPGASGNTAENDVLDHVFGTDLIGRADVANGSFGSRIELSGTSNLRIDYFGAEAAFANTFAFGDNTLVTTPGVFGDAAGNTPGVIATSPSSPLASFGFSDVAGGILDFTFTSQGRSVANGVGNNQNVARAANFFASQADDGSIWLFLDDGGGNGVESGADDNHDDLVIRISAVPLPAGGLLLLTGLGALALRRRKKAA